MMKRRNLGVQNVNPNYGSTYRIQSDQKEVIIGKLQNDAKSLKKNQQELNLMKDQYTGLERKYRSLLEEKNLQEGEFKNKHQSAVRHICQLRNQVDAIKAQLREKKVQTNDLEADCESLRSLVDQRNIQVEKYRGDINALSADSQQLEGERRALAQHQDNLRKTNSSLREELGCLDRESSSVEQRLGEMGKYFSQLQIQSNLLKQKIKDFENQNNELDRVVQGIIQDIAELDNQIYEAQSDIADLQSNNASISCNVDQFRQEAIHNQKAAQTEIMKNNDLLKNIKQADNTLKVRINQVEEGRSEVGALKHQNQNLQKVNTQLEDDLEACKKHMENLVLLNHQLITNLQRFSQEDRNVSQLIDRRGRVDHMRMRVQESNIQLDRSKKGDQSGRSTQRSYQY